jgi:hypothetical protein
VESSGAVFDYCSTRDNGVGASVRGAATPFTPPSAPPSAPVLAPPSAPPSAPVLAPPSAPVLAPPSVLVLAPVLAPDLSDIQAIYEWPTAATLAQTQVPSRA